MLFIHVSVGGCFVEGEWLRNAFRWKESIGPWEERPGHFGNVWMYWTDDGLGYFEFLQVGILLNAHGYLMFTQNWALNYIKLYNVFLFS